MRIRKCDLCEYNIPRESGVGFLLGRKTFDLCKECVKIVRVAICRECKGTEKVKVRDDEATTAQATCRENRTQYKTIKCENCS